MKRETKELLKNFGKLIGSEMADLGNLFTLGIPKTLLEQHTERKIAERLKPNLRKRPPEQQQWDRVKLGMSEKEVGGLLGLPSQIQDEYDDYEAFLQQDERKKITRWLYNYRKGIFTPIECGVVFRKGKVMRFWDGL
jgi:hypothetical protein